jgi:hypothetical protein
MCIAHRRISLAGVHSRSDLDPNGRPFRQGRPQINVATVFADIADPYADAGARARFGYLRISYERHSQRCASFFFHKIRLPL